MIHAAGLFRSGAVKRLNIPSLVMSDGPSGVRQEFENDSWTPIDDTTDFVSWLPSNTCLCTTWNPNLARKFGEVLGDEARGRGKDVILAPGINIKRTPLCGSTPYRTYGSPFGAGNPVTGCSCLCETFCPE